MKNATRIAGAVLAGLALLTAGSAARRGDSEPDRLCRMLSDEYVVGTGKIDTSTRMAAAHIVAERGRESGFWRDVFRMLPEDDGRNEIACVRVLGKMLAIDALSHDAQRRRAETGEMSQGETAILVAQDVVEELIARGEKAGRNRADHYAIALARARRPEARAFFRRILVGEAGQPALGTARFHAAVGLAHLGDPAGFEWWIANSGNSTISISNAWPRRAPSLRLDACSVAALQQLSGQDALRTRAEWEAWWARTDETKAVRGYVDLVEP